MKVRMDQYLDDVTMLTTLMMLTMMPKATMMLTACMYQSEGGMHRLRR